MTAKRIIFSAAIVLAIGILIWWFAGSRQLESAKQSGTTRQQSQSNESLPETQRTAADSSRNEKGPSVGIDLENPDNWWKAPISFYGKVVDENDNPVPGADIKFIVNDESPQGTTDYQRKSDERGLFALTGVLGGGTNVYVSKEGYYTSRIQRVSFKYAGTEPIFVPDPRNPFIFRLRKKGEMPPLVVYELEIPIKLGEKVPINLATGNVDPKDGQVEIELLLNKGGKRLQREWSLRLSVTNGGILLSTEEYPFTAPETGYQEFIIANMESKKPPTWNGNIYEGGEFFVKTKNGYGRVILKMVVGGPQLRLTTFFNQTGSRNLESEHY